MTNQKIESDTLFIDQWEAYQWALDSNLGGHKELINISSCLITSAFQNKPVILTDLGCGNSCLIPALTSGVTLDFYYGIDLAENAIMASRTFLQQKKISCQHVQQSLFEGILTQCKMPNLIYSAFAIHHGDYKDKQQLFNNLYQQTRKGTLFLLADITRYEKQTDDDYFNMVRQHLINHQCREDWLEYLMHHVTCFDHPETKQELCSMAKAAGWRLNYQCEYSPYKNFPLIMMLLERI